MRLVVEARAIAVATDYGVELAVEVWVNLPILLPAQGSLHAHGFI